MYWTTLEISAPRCALMCYPSSNITYCIACLLCIGVILLNKFNSIQFNSWYVLVPVWKKSWSRTVIMRWHARNALVHLPVMMSATPPKATMSSISTHDAFISVPMHPRNEISVCIIPGCNASDVQQ